MFRRQLACFRGVPVGVKGLRSLRDGFAALDTTSLLVQKSVGAAETKSVFYREVW